MLLAEAIQMKNVCTNQRNLIFGGLSNLSVEHSWLDLPHTVFNFFVKTEFFVPKKTTKTTQKHAKTEELSKKYNNSNFP